jgi:eukaryotic-like serine/threonine-protein kinase
VHGNVHPGTTLIADDGRVVLADARADSADDHEGDVRAVGGILYYSLTGHWPHAEVGASALPDANRDGGGNPATPRQIRAGVPAYLDDLTMDLLDKRVAAPEADALAAELARLDAAAEEDYEDVGPLRFAQNTTTEPSRSTPKIVVGVATLAVIAIIGLVFGIRAITSSGDPGPTTTNKAGAGTTAGTGTDGGTDTPAPQPKKIALTGNMVRIVDPPKGDREDTGQAAFTVDNDPDTVWETQRFTRADFGNLKKGMGVLINLGTPRRLAEISVETSSPGVAMDIRTGPADYGDNSDGDKKIVGTYKKLGDGDTEKTDGTRQVFSVFDPNQKYQYVLVFLTELPRAEEGGGYKVSVNKIELTGY